VTVTAPTGQDRGTARAPAQPPLALRTLSYAGLSGLVMGLCCLVPAGSLRYGQAWLLLGIHNGGVLAIFAYLLVRDLPCSSAGSAPAR